MAHLTRRPSLLLALGTTFLLACTGGPTDPIVQQDPIQDPIPATAPAEEPPPSSTEVMPPAVGELFVRTDGLPEEPEGYHGGGLEERYDVADDGTFRLQFLSARWGFFEYLGSYSRAGAVLDLNFEEYNTAGEWRATGTLHGDCLTVEYNIVMWLADFRPGEYCRPSTS